MFSSAFQVSIYQRPLTRLSYSIRHSSRNTIFHLDQRPRRVRIRRESGRVKSKFEYVHHRFQVSCLSHNNRPFYQFLNAGLQNRGTKIRPLRRVNASSKQIPIKLNAAWYSGSTVNKVSSRHIDSFMNLVRSYTLHSIGLALPIIGLCRPAHSEK